MNVVRNNVKDMNETSTNVINEVDHKRLWHFNHKVIKRMLKNPAYKVKGAENAAQKSCPTCVKENHKKSPANRMLIEPSDNVTIHLDICGPMSVWSIETRHYFLIMINVQQTFRRVNILRTRVDAMAYIWEFAACLDRNLE